MNDDDFDIPSDHELDEQSAATPRHRQNQDTNPIVINTVGTGLESDDEMEEKRETERVLQRRREMVPKVMTEHDQRLSRCTRVQFEGDGTMNRHQIRKIPLIGTFSMRWKFGGTFWRRRLYGDAVQVNQYPSYWISRHPVHWGWVMQSMWVIYTSFAMPEMDSMDDRRIQTDEFGERGFVEMMQYNVMGGVTAVNGDLEEDSHRGLTDSAGMVDLEVLKAVKWDKERQQRIDREILNENTTDLGQYLASIQNYLQHEDHAVSADEDEEHEL